MSGKSYTPSAPSPQSHSWHSWALTLINHTQYLRPLSPFWTCLTMRSVSPLNSTMSADSTYPHIHFAKLNAYWLATKPPFDYATRKFLKWSTKLEIFFQQSGLDQYIFVSEKNPSRLITQLDQIAEPNMYANWLSNNNLIIGVIHSAVSKAEQEKLETNETVKECYDSLKAHAQCEGPVKQVVLICQALSTYVQIAEPIDITACRICELINQAFSIGAIDKNLLKCIALLNSINDKSFESLQTQVLWGLIDATKNAPYTLSHIRKLFQTVDSLSTLTKAPSVDTALTAHDFKAPSPSQSWSNLPLLWGLLCLKALMSWTHKGMVCLARRRNGWKDHWGV